jgi:hypothetical protein
MEFSLLIPVCQIGTYKTSEDKSARTGTLRCSDLAEFRIRSGEMDQYGNQTVKIPGELSIVDISSLVTKRVDKPTRTTNQHMLLPEDFYARLARVVLF